MTNCESCQDYLICDICNSTYFWDGDSCEQNVLMGHGLNQTHAHVSPAYLTVLFVQLAQYVILVVQLTSRKEIHVHRHVLQENMQILQQVLVRIVKPIVSLVKVILYVIHVFQHFFGIALNALRLPTIHLAQFREWKM